MAPNDDLPVPPDRDLPPDVRERLRVTVVSGLDDRQRRLAVRGPLAAAAGVALLATTGLLVARSVHGGTPVPSAGAAKPAVAPQNPDVARCAAALTGAGLRGTWPGQARWQPVFDVSDSGRRVTAVLAGGRPMFCETTLTTVTVSGPAQPASGAAARVLLGSDDGVVAGVVGSDTDQLDVGIRDSTGDHRATATVENGMFVAFGPAHGVRHSTVRVRTPATGGWSAALPTPAPALFRTDRPQHPTDPAHDPCVTMPAADGGPVLDAGSWRRGAAFGDTPVTVDYNSAAGALCVGDDEPDFRYLGQLPAVGDTPLRVAYREHRDDAGLRLAGLVAPNVGRIEFTSPAGTSRADVVGPTFTATVPVTEEPDDENGQDVHVIVLDASGDEIYRGALPRLSP